MKSTPHTSLHSLTTEEMLAYLENRLPEAKHQQVEAFLADNELYREAVEALRQQMHDEAAMQELEARENQMDKTLQQLPISPPMEETKPNFLWALLQQPVLRYGIAAALVCTLAFFLWPKQGYENPDQLAEAYLNHFEDPMGPLTKEEDALNLYSESNYDDAIPLFQELLAEGQDPSKEIRFRMLLGVSLLQVGSIRQAEQEFALVIQAKPTDNYHYIAGAHWYMALSLLKRGKIPEAKSSLNALLQLGDEDASIKERKKHQARAQLMLEELERLERKLQSKASTTTTIPKTKYQPIPCQKGGLSLIASASPIHTKPAQKTG